MMRLKTLKNLKAFVFNKHLTEILAYEMNNCV